jgi:hypothetical protein
LALPALLAHSDIRLIFTYLLAFFWLFAFSLTVAIKPRVKLTPLNITIYPTYRQKIHYLYIDDIKKISHITHSLIIVTKDNRSFTLPSLSRRSRQRLITYLAHFNIASEDIS